MPRIKPGRKSRWEGNEGAHLFAGGWQFSTPFPCTYDWSPVAVIHICLRTISITHFFFSRSLTHHSPTSHTKMDRSDSNNNNNNNERRAKRTLHIHRALSFTLPLQVHHPPAHQTFIPPPPSPAIKHHQAGLKGMEVKESSQRLKAGW